MDDQIAAAGSSNALAATHGTSAQAQPHANEQANKATMDAAIIAAQQQ